jgi:predicted alpha/beta superfamily hydrolase
VEPQYYNPTSDAYLEMLVKEVKPYIDQHYRTLTGRDDTAIAGSSMGGLISLYALQQYPEVGVFLPACLT